MLVFVRERHFVARARLHGDTERVDVARVGIARFDCFVARVIPPRRVACVGIGERALDEREVGVLARASEEPDTIALDRSTETAAHVPQRDGLGRLVDPVRAQLIVDIA